ncbi:MAG: hypothetical protein NVS1B4_03370 [Gemmatimonadaceae bacterium]
MTKRMAVALLAVVGLFVSLYLTLYKLGIVGELACTIGSCETVQLSRWSTLFGLPVAAWGVGFYVAALVAAMIGVQPQWVNSPSVSLVLLTLTGWGLAFSLWLTGLELFVIHAICQWCVVSAAIVVALFVLAIADWREMTGRSRRGDVVGRPSAP